MIFGLEQKPAEAPALVDAEAGTAASYGELTERVQAAAELLRRGGRRLVFLLASNTAPSIIAYLACMEAGQTVCLIEAGPQGIPARLVETYHPELILEGQVPASLDNTTLQASGPLHPDLALLLTTSGSTGNPKLVRLTEANVEANAASIAGYLQLDSAECAMQSLPVHYSYGLSILNSHLFAGARVVLTPHSFLTSAFWDAFREHGCTSFAGVPFMYETLDRLRFQPSKYPALKTMTQAGGKLKSDLVEEFRRKCDAAGARLVVMYGQTEATARISWVPPDRLREKTGSVGIAIPEGKLELCPVPESPDLNELVYSGPNVMMGYAESRESLAEGDVMGGRLRTGDLGRQDADGFFYITGRLKRFAKLFGNRVSLDDVEQQAEAAWPVQAAAVDRDGTLALFIVPRRNTDTAMVKSGMAAYLGVPPTAVKVVVMEELPLTSSGKKDYQKLP